MSMGGVNQEELYGWMGFYEWKGFKVGLSMR